MPIFQALISFWIGLLEDYAKGYCIILCLLVCYVFKLSNKRLEVFVSKVNERNHFKLKAESDVSSCREIAWISRHTIRNNQGQSIVLDYNSEENFENIAQDVQDFN